jgi:hypothetical protein
MVSYLNSFPQQEIEATNLTPEQKLWRAVFVQAIQDTFGISSLGMSRDEWQESKKFGRIYDQDFIELCEFAGFDSQKTFEKLKRYDLIKKGIIWNYTTNGKRRFADVVTTN